MAVLSAVALDELALAEVESSTVTVNNSSQTLLLTTNTEPEVYIISNPALQDCFLKFADDTALKQGVVLGSRDNVTITSKAGEIYVVHAIMAAGANVNISITRFF